MSDIDLQPRLTDEEAKRVEDTLRRLGYTRVEFSTGFESMVRILGQEIRAGRSDIFSMLRAGRSAIAARESSVVQPRQAP